MPIPKAKPENSSGSTPAARSTFGWTMPQPPHSIQPVPLQVRQPRSLPAQTKQSTSSSALGSVKGKNEGRSRVRTPGPNMPRAKWSRVPLRWAIVRPLSTARPSTWWNTGVWVASSSSVRKTLPGQMTYTGTPRSSRARTCTGLVCVRSSRPFSGGSTKKVSCIWRAGWSGSKLSASKLNHSASTSGPSATSQPMPTKTSVMRSVMVSSGWRAPGAVRSTGSVTSTASCTMTRASRSASSSSRRASSAFATTWRALPTRWPASLRAAGGRAPISRLARASGLTSPACSRRTCLKASRSGAAARAARAWATAWSTASWLSIATSTGSYWVFGPDMVRRPLRRMREGPRVCQITPRALPRVSAWAVRAGGGVEADGGGGGEVEALGAAVDRDPDDGVGRGEGVLRQAPRLVAEHPGDRAREGALAALGVVLQVVEVGGARDVRRQHRETGAAQRLDGVGERDARRHRQVEQAPGAGADALGVEHVDARVGEHAPAGTRGVRGPHHRAGVAWVADVRQDGHEPGGRRHEALERDVDEGADGDEPLRGHRVAHRGQHVRRGKADDAPGVRRRVEHGGVPLRGVRRGVQREDDGSAPGADRVHVGHHGLGHRLRALGDES